MGLAILLLLGVVGCQQLEIRDKRGVSRFQSAYAGFLSEAARVSCLRADQIETLARSRDWIVERPDPRLDWQTGLPDPNSLRLFVEPPMPFAKEPGIQFLFDQDDCSQRR